MLMGEMKRVLKAGKFLPVFLSCDNSLGGFDILSMRKMKEEHV